MKWLCWKKNSFLWGLCTLQISHRLKVLFNLMLDEPCFFRKGLPPPLQIQRFLSKVKLKFPAKITFLSWKSSKSFKLFGWFSSNFRANIVLIYFQVFQLWMAICKTKRIYNFAWKTWRNLAVYAYIISYLGMYISFQDKSTFSYNSYVAYGLYRKTVTKDIVY